MAESQLSIRSARAHALANRLAETEQLTVTQVVEQALEAYAAARVEREPATSFYARLGPSFGTDLDLEAVIKSQRQPHDGIEL
ncbi:MAG: type II toxin-antitoxin system VapB family antitoxin [Xanthomonadales bacterium]|jgi:hypothetical protein|nr:type II toxin-antitoxin system VapB family antitoxin [Xanthomonadales bacterium]